VTIAVYQMAEAHKLNAVRSTMTRKAITLK